MAKKSDDTYSEEDAERRLIAALRGARVTGPKPMKDVPRKRAESKPQKLQAELKAGKTRRAVVAEATVTKPKAGTKKPRADRSQRG